LFCQGTAGVTCSVLSVAPFTVWLCVDGLPVSSRDDAKANENKKKTYVCTHIMQIAQKLGIFTFGSF
jgi:hypothetical protein